MSEKNILDGLDNEQRDAVILQRNGVVTAGAGSGKTRVLASRYAWLITRAGLRPEQILTLTFTNKAVSEMYSRIYRYLLTQAGQNADEKAAEALAEFYRARISTLDSFSAGVARTAAVRYGISPDFKSDDAALRSTAREAALQFVLDNRDDPAVRQLLPDHKIRKLADELFAKTALYYSPVSSPPDFKKMLEAQKTFITGIWREKISMMETAVTRITEVLRSVKTPKDNNFLKSLSQILLNDTPPLPDINVFLESENETDENADNELLPARQQIKKYFDFYSALIALKTPGNFSDYYAEAVENFKLIKGKDRDGLYFELESIANYCLNYGFCAGVYKLLDRFQKEFNNRKRETGLLTFNDIANLAVDAFREHPDIRKVYKDSFRMIMIDEFQDNNALQRDLIYLLAEKAERNETGVPSPCDLEENRMFFVGDEKQSIYRFRGADVAVFRTLGRGLFNNNDIKPGSRPQGNSGGITLVHNYRSAPPLITAFNHIFARVFLSRGNDNFAQIPDYEAVYDSIHPPEIIARNERDTDNDNRAENVLMDGKHLYFCFLNEDELPGDDVSGVKSYDLEAVFIARKIRSLVGSGKKIPVRTDNGIMQRACSWSDFAVLERTYTHQGTLEMYFREFGVPYSTDRPSGLFNDAPVMDMRAYLRLLVYPDDRIAYAALIRSPFMRLSDLTLSVCMLSGNPEPFAGENEELIPKEELALYQRARERYLALRETSRSLSAAELVTRLWFEEGYRHETLWTESAQVYESLFDLFFSLASDSDVRGNNLAEFIEYLDDVMNREEKPDDKDIPGEGESGVKIMSIHKAKGLEFPVVFIYNCAHSGIMHSPWGLVNYHEKYGLVPDIPQADELPIGGNFFRKIIEEEERTKDIAELRRLLYVAMTRAESLLYLTASVPRQTKEEKKVWNISGSVTGENKFDEDVMRHRLAQLDEKTGTDRRTFLELLLPVLSGPSGNWAFEGIPVLTRNEISALSDKQHSHSQRETVMAASSFYESAVVLPEGRAFPSSIEASALRYKPSGIVAHNAVPEFTPADSADSTVSADSDLGGLEPRDFGALVHAVLESGLTGRPCVIPRKIHSLVENEKSLDKILSLAKSMAKSFFDSELGGRLAASKNKKIEYPVITSVTINGEPLAIMGQIDLLFEEDNEVVVVDFKTDKTERPEDHYGQLACYYRAASDIFGKPASVWLFYLRSGNAVNVTENVKGLSLEEMAAEAFGAFK